jgi:hypothetical protein
MAKLLKATVRKPEGSRLPEGLTQGDKVEVEKMSDQDYLVWYQNGENVRGLGVQLPASQVEVG